MSVNAVVFSFARIYPDSMVASQRIALLVAKELNLPLLTDLNIGKDAPKRLDLLLIVNGAYGFCRCLPELAELIEKARRIVWIQNDYGIIPPKPESGAESPFRFAFRKRREMGKSHLDYWTTIMPNVKLTAFSNYINWNALTFRNGKPPENDRNDRLVYYGSWRHFGSSTKSRVKYFDRYFKQPSVPITVSSPFVKGRNKFALSYPKVCHVDKFSDLHENLTRYGAGLYLEDVASHSEFHSPPNRFYEMLSAGLPIIFQPECGSTLRQAGYDPTPYQAGTQLQLKRQFDDRKIMGKAQQLTWFEKARSDNASVVPALHAAMAKMEDMP